MGSNLPDIDRLIYLAKHQPDELEKLRQREIEALIANAPPRMQRRLRGLQFQIDCNRRLHKTPLGSCISLSRMMLESVNRLNDALHRGLDVPATHPSPPTIPASARVIQFPAPVSRG